LATGIGVMTTRSDRPAGDTIMMNSCRQALTALGLTAILLMASAGSALAQQGDAIVGTWLVQVTLRNCQSGAALGPAIFTLVTFHSDGTISESASGTNFAPGQRTNAHGSWNRTGARTYQQNMLALIVFDTPAGYPVPPGGFLAGGQVVNHTMTLVDNNHLTSTGTNAFYTNSMQLYRSGCSTAEAVRFP
jgi:hypothetical protein